MDYVYGSVEHSTKQILTTQIGVTISVSPMSLIRLILQYSYYLYDRVQFLYLFLHTHLLFSMNSLTSSCDCFRFVLLKNVLSLAFVFCCRFGNVAGLELHQGLVSGSKLDVEAYLG